MRAHNKKSNALVKPKDEKLPKNGFWPTKLFVRIGPLGKQIGTMRSKRTKEIQLSIDIIHNNRDRIFFSFHL